MSLVRVFSSELSMQGKGGEDSMSFDRCLSILLKVNYPACLHF